MQLVLTGLVTLSPLSIRLLTASMAMDMKVDGLNDKYWAVILAVAPGKLAASGCMGDSQTVMLCLRSCPKLMAAAAFREIS